MGQGVAFNAPIEKLVIEIRGHIYDAKGAQARVDKHQLQAGQRLIELRAHIERDGWDWWAFFDEQFTGHIKSRSYAEKLMRWARADDPEAAIDAERERARVGMKESRERAARNVTRTEEVQDNNSGVPSPDDAEPPIMPILKAHRTARKRSRKAFLHWWKWRCVFRTWTCPGSTTQK